MCNISYLERMNYDGRDGFEFVGIASPVVGHSRRDLPRDRASRWVRSSTSFPTHELAHTMYVYEDAPGSLGGLIPPHIHARPIVLGAVSATWSSLWDHRLVSVLRDLWSPCWLTMVKNLPSHYLPSLTPQRLTPRRVVLGEAPVVSILANSGEGFPAELVHFPSL